MLIKENPLFQKMKDRQIAKVCWITMTRKRISIDQLLIVRGGERAVFATGAAFPYGLSGFRIDADEETVVHREVDEVVDDDG